VESNLAKQKLENVEAILHIERSQLRFLKEAWKLTRYIIDRVKNWIGWKLTQKCNEVKIAKRRGDMHGRAFILNNRIELVRENQVQL